MTKHWTTKFLGFVLQLFAAAFIFLLMTYTISKLPPLIERNIASCQEELKVQEEKKSALNFTQYTEEEKEYIDEEIAALNDQLVELEEREQMYSISMVLLVGVLFLGAIFQEVKTYTFKGKRLGIGDVSVGYSPYIAVPLSATCMLMAIGITYQSLFGWGRGQLLMLIGAIIAGFCVFYFYRRTPYIASKLDNYFGVRKYSVSDILYILVILLMIGLFVWNYISGLNPDDKAEGARLWIKLGGFTVQPGEFIKVLMIMVFGASYGKKWRAIVAMMVSAVIIFGFLLLNDMGGAFIVFAMLIVMIALLLDNKMTFSVFDHKKILILVLFGALCLFVVALASMGYAKTRILNVGNAMLNTDSTQQADAIKALIFGGLKGLGIENADYLYRVTYVYSDMAIAGLTAVFGFGMLLVTLLCYAVLIVMPLRKHAVYRQFYFSSALVSVSLFVQVLFNALGSVDVLPFTGIVAPFISDGGSALISFSCMIGLLLAAQHPLIRKLEVNFEREQ